MVVKVPKSHDKCLLCGQKNRAGMNLEFKIGSDKSVTTTVDTSVVHQGYEGILHGGVITSLLDCAMCHALFSIDVEAVTGDMKISFHKEVPVGATLIVTAKVLNARGPLYKTEAFLTVDGDKCASAQARFVKRKRVVEVE